MSLCKATKVTCLLSILCPWLSLVIFVVVAVSSEVAEWVHSCCCVPAWEPTLHQLAGRLSGSAGASRSSLATGQPSQAGQRSKST